MNIEQGKTYCGADARIRWDRKPNQAAADNEVEQQGIEGEMRRVLSVNEDHVMFERRLGQPVVVSLSEFLDWAKAEVVKFLGRWAYANDVK